MRATKSLSRRSLNISRNNFRTMQHVHVNDSRGVASAHVPVLLEEVLAFLRPQQCGVFLDGTVGMGGHASAFLRQMRADSVYVGIDKDKESLAVAEERLREFKERTFLFHGDYKSFDVFLNTLKIKKVDGILLDLGISSYQLEQSFRGFSFNKNAPLDMRMDRTSLISASDLVNNLSELELANIFKTFGEERWHKRIARRIVEERKKTPILSTQQLAEIIGISMPFARGKLHPATRAFQALRIAVNRELESLQECIDKLIPFCAAGARIGIISFHSLEDRIVKHTFKKYAATGGLRILTKKPIVPSEKEIDANNRARSAKLRVAECIK